MADAARLSSADFVLIHCVGWIEAIVIRPDPNEEMMRSIMAEVLPQVTRADAMIADFAKVAEGLLAAGTSGGAGWAAAQWDAAQVIARWHRMRAARAWDVFKEGKRDG